MTGYGKAELETELAYYVIEIQSINRKHLDISVYLPRELGRVEQDFRKWISQVLTRGQINVKLRVEYKTQTPTTLKPQLLFAEQLKEALDRINLHIGAPAQKWTAIDLVRASSSIIAYEDQGIDEERCREEVQAVCAQALQKLMSMKEKEGQALAKDLTARLSFLRDAIKEITRLSPDAVEKARQKLTQRLAELLPQLPDNEDRVLREIVLYTEKCDIAEEITRFNAHLDQLNDCIQSKETAVGKTFEFVLQEVLREANTIGSKASDVQVTRQVVAIKSEIEKLREQIQNVE